MDNNSIKIDNGVLCTAVTTYGNRAQCDMVIEEMSELTKAICKLYRAGDPLEEKLAVTHILDETADVYIMLAQLGIMFDPELTRIQDNIDAKMDRLNERLVSHLSRPQKKETGEHTTPAPEDTAK